MTEVLPDEKFIERLKVLTKEAGSAEKLAKCTGVPARNIGKYLAGSDPSGKRLVALARGANVNLDWLATGEGPMKRGEPGKVSEMHLAYSHNNNIELKVFALAGAGHPNELIDTEPVAEIVVPKDFYKPSIVPVKIRGRSMEDTIMDGAIVGVDRADKWVVSGEIFAVWMPYEGAVVKRLYLDTEKITCKSDNSKFADFMIPLDKVDEHFIQGRVKWVIQQY